MPKWSAVGGTIDSNGVYIARDVGGTFEVTVSANGISSRVVIVIEADQTTAIKDLPLTFIQVKVAPNPFVDHIRFEIQLSSDSKIELRFFDLNGRKLTEQKENLSSGNQLIEWHGDTDLNHSFTSGIYYQLKIGKQFYSGKRIKL